MYLGIEIGGTKLQLGVGAGNGEPLVALERSQVDAAKGAPGILEAIAIAGKKLLAAHDVQAIGIGFGGPLEVKTGRVLKSHHIHGWDQFPLAEWCRTQFARPVSLHNDADTACLAEATFGAGRGADPVLYVTVGTGIGGGLVSGGKIYTGSGRGAIEIGHLRPGLQADQAEDIVEASASGWGIAEAARIRLAGQVAHRLTDLGPMLSTLDREQVRQRILEAEEADEQAAGDLLRRCDRDPEQVTTAMVATAAREGNPLARQVLTAATDTLGWALAQAITMLGPERVVVGGGVSLAGEELFFAPLREQIARYVFPPFLGSYNVVGAALGEEVVVHGALVHARTDSK